MLIVNDLFWREMEIKFPPALFSEFWPLSQNSDSDLDFYFFQNNHKEIIKDKM